MIKFLRESLLARRADLVAEIAEIDALLVDDPSVAEQRPEDVQGIAHMLVDPVEAFTVLPDPAEPEADEPLWLSGHGELTYGQAILLASQSGLQLIVSTTKGGPTADQQYRIAHLEPILGLDDPLPL